MSIEYFNLIKFNEYTLLKSLCENDDELLKTFLDTMTAKKAILDFESLITAINSVDINSDADKVEQLSSVLKDLISEYDALPITAKNEMKELIKTNSFALLSNKEAKEQYDEYLIDFLFLDEIATGKIPPKLHTIALAEVLSQPKNVAVEKAIEEAGKEFLHGLQNQLLERTTARLVVETSIRVTSYPKRR